jgi:very-short-patch-repair endonuclease
MTGQTRHRTVWSLARSQHGLVTRAQLLELGYTRHAIEHRVAQGRLHPVHRAVFIVGRPELDLNGRCMAAVLACGSLAVVSHQTAAELWGIRKPGGGPIEVSAPATIQRKLAGVRLHRRRSLRETDRAVRDGIAVTSPARTLVDLAARLSQPALEAAVNEADKRDLIDPELLRLALDELPRQRGVPALRRLLDRRTFRLTDSELERRFLRLVRGTGLPIPLTRVVVNGFRVDFFWPELGLVVETDGLRYHRTPIQQARDRRRDQIHTAAGLTTMRFTHGQIRFEPADVQRLLIAVVKRLVRRRDAA